MAWSTPDLSDITQVLKGLLETAINNSNINPGNIKVFCDSPDAARQTDGNCHLTIYLLHVGRDPYWRNTPLQGPRPQLNNAQALSLNLSYLLTAWSDKDFATEQRAMSIALQAIHGQPIVTQNLILQDHLTQFLPNGEFVMSIEADTIDEMSRLWQAFTVPIRLSALVRVGVVFIAPLAAIGPPEIAPSVTNLSVAPQPTPATEPLLVNGLGLQVPPLPPGAVPALSITPGPLIAAGATTLAILGNGLDLPAASQVFLRAAGGPAEWNVTPWRQGVTAGELDLLLPAAYADPTVTPPPSATPLPGAYTLALGSGTARSNTISLTIAPRVDGVTNPPLLSPNAAGLYSVAGAGFIAGPATTLALGANMLGFTAGSPGAGQFAVNATGTGITFKLPAAIAAGYYPVLLAVSGVAATTGWVVSFP